MNRLPFLVLAALAATGFPTAHAQTPADEGTQVTIASGLSQPILFGGGNVSATVKRGRVVADYSHGFALDYNARGDFALTETQREQGLDIDTPWTTGFGVGYRITPRFDVRAEFKAHRYKVDPPADQAFAYTTFTVGAGVYYEIPIWRGLTLEPSVRYWPTVATTLDGGERAFSSATGATQIHEAFSIPPFVNASIGWRW